MSLLSHDLSLQIWRIVSHDGVKQGLLSIAGVRLSALHLEALHLLCLVRWILVIGLVDAS